MTIEDFKTIINSRIANLELKVQEAKNDYAPLMHKSRHCRMTYGIGLINKKNFYEDKAAELQSLLSFLDGIITKEEYLGDLVNDDLTRLLDLLFRGKG